VRDGARGSLCRVALENAIDPITMLQMIVPDFFDMKKSFPQCGDNKTHGLKEDVGSLSELSGRYLWFSYFSVGVHRKVFKKIKPNKAVNLDTYRNERGGALGKRCIYAVGPA
jgi:hypothetical protein